MDDASRTIYVNCDLVAYGNFLPDEWAESVFEKAKTAPCLDNLLLDLTQTWRAVAYTASMPSAFVRSVQGAVLSYARHKTSDASIASFGGHVLSRVADELRDEVSLSRKLRRTIAGRISVIAKEFREQAAKIEPQMSIEEVWQEFFRKDKAGDGFAQSIWGSQRVSYVAFYNEYEAFLIQCAKVVLGKSSLRITDKSGKKEFYDALRSKFGTDLFDVCWGHSEINIARLVRHALSHAGGQETDDLKKLNHGFMLADGKIQIGPQHVHRMLRHLLAGVTALVAAAAVLPAFATIPSQPQDDDD
ncbi:MAG TPA: hypothetical protein VGM05_16885 [Planctomycetaceae bacterium]|jgi:hypothetical protein